MEKIRLRMGAGYKLHICNMTDMPQQVTIQTKDGVVIKMVFVRVNGENVKIIKTVRRPFNEPKNYLITEEGEVVLHGNLITVNAVLDGRIVDTITVSILN